MYYTFANVYYGRSLVNQWVEQIFGHAQIQNTHCWSRHQVESRQHWQVMPHVQLLNTVCVCGARGWGGGGGGGGGRVSGWFKIIALPNTRNISYCLVQVI